MVLAVIGLFLFSCQKYAEVNTVSADENLKASQGTAWLQSSSSATQFMTTSPTQFTIDQDDGNAQVELNNGNITVNRSGEYLIVAAPQVGRIGVGLQGVVSFKCWLRVNGTDVANSNVLLNLKPWTKDVIISQGIVSLEKGDVVTVMGSCGDNDRGVAIEAIQEPGEPLVPSIIFTMYEIN